MKVLELLVGTVVVSSAFLFQVGQAKPPTTCPVASATSTILPESNLCPCQEGWAGTDCQICQSDKACAGSGGRGATTCLSTPLGVDTISQSRCDVTMNELNQFLGGQAATVVELHKEGDNKLTMDMDIYSVAKDSGNYIAAFGCHSRECRKEKEEGGNMTRVRCTATDCTMFCEVGKTPWCFEGLRGIVNGIGKRGPLDVVCAPEGGICRIDEDVIKTTFNKGIGLANCQWGYCGLPSNETVAVVSFAEVRGKEVYAGANIIMSGLATALVLLAIALGLFVYHWTNTRLLVDAHKALLTTQEVDPAFIGGNGKAWHGSGQRGITMAFKDITYTVMVKGAKKEILKGVSGKVTKGQVLGVMGPSGSGKSTLLEVLAMRQKAGVVGGDIAARAEEGDNEVLLPRSLIKGRVGYLDQDSHLLPTATVLESLLFSATLRLPQKDMTMEQKIQRVVDVMRCLKIDHLADSIIGTDTTRGISGGEVRRVGVGMELVTNPGMLILDEPTSGLDSFNADSLVALLSELASSRGMAVALSLHQPRQEIFDRLDKVLVMQRGEVAYSGPPQLVVDYLQGLGLPIPLGKNPADTLIDFVFISEGHRKHGSTLDLVSKDVESSGVGSAFDGSLKALTTNSSVDGNRQPMEEEDDETEAKEEKRSPSTVDASPMKALSKAWATSEHRKHIDREIEAVFSLPQSQQNPTSPGRQENSAALARPPSFLLQCAVLSQRLMRDMLRKPILLASHFAANIYFGILLGILYYKIPMSGISAVQNRMGIFMLESLFLAFTSISALPLFWLERRLYVYESGNNFYSPAAYFVCKVLSDLIPLRLLPPLLLSVLTTLLADFRLGNNFYIYTLSLLLMSAISASVNILLGMVVTSIMAGILTATILMMHLLLLTPIFVNFDTMKLQFLSVIRYLSFFNFGYEALVANELRGRSLEGIPISSTALLQQLGFHPVKMHQDVMALFIYLAVVLLVAFICLVKVVRERK